MSDRYPDSTLDAKFAALEEKLDDHFEATSTDGAGNTVCKFTANGTLIYAPSSPSDVNTNVIFFGF